MKKALILLYVLFGNFSLFLKIHILYKLKIQECNIYKYPTYNRKIRIVWYFYMRIKLCWLEVVPGP